MKIHILGGPGSGKTTLAEDIAARFHIPHHDLDKLGWKHGPRLAAYIEDAFAIVEQPGWVAEGIYLIWTDPLLYAADYIVLLEVSWPVAVWRIIYRHFSKSLRGINPYSSKLLLPFIKDTQRYYVNRYRSAEEVKSVDMYLKEHGDDLELSNAAILLMRLEKYRLGISPTAAFLRTYLEKYKEKVIVVKSKADRERFLEILANRLP